MSREANPSWLDPFDDDLERLDMAIGNVQWDASPEINELVRASMTLANKLRVKANSERLWPTRLPLPGTP